MEVSNSNLININCCSIKNKKSVLLENISWKMQKKQAWLLIGPNGGGKADFVNALSGKYEFLPEEKIGTGNFSKFVRSRFSGKSSAFNRRRTKTR